MFGNQPPVESEATTRPPMPDMPPIRTFEVTRVDANNGELVTEIVLAHAVDFTTAGGVFYTRMTPEYVQMNGEEGWSVVKRIVNGWSSYESHREIFDIISALSIQ